MGGLMIVYLVAISLSLYTITIRRNELYTCLSGTMYSAMKTYYVPGIWQVEGRPGCSNAHVEQEVIREMKERIQNPDDLQVTVYVCDMEKGILAVEAEEVFLLPSGQEKSISARRTLIVDRENR